MVTTGEGRALPTTTANFAANASAPASAREALSTFLGPRVPTRFADDARLLTSELVSNSVLHSSLAPTELISVDLDLDEHRLRVTVSDSESPFPSGPPRETGGWGFVLMDRISTRWGIHRNVPNAVWFELDR